MSRAADIHVPGGSHNRLQLRTTPVRQGLLAWSLREAVLDPILLHLHRSDRTPPEALEGAIRATPFFEVGQGEFLLRTPSGGRMHFATGQGIAVSEPVHRPAGDLQPFVVTSGFAAAAWLAGYVPLAVNAARLPDGQLLLIGHGTEDLREAMAVAMAQAAGLALADSPLAIDPEDPTQVCTNGQSITLRRVSKDAPEPPVRAGARRLATALPAIDGSSVHRCAGMLCLAEAGPMAGAPGLERLSMLQAIAEIRKHVCMALVGTAIWGQETIGTANMVLAGNLPMLRFTLAEGQKITPDLADALLADLLTPEAG